MKVLVFLCIVTCTLAVEKCAPITNNCGPIGLVRNSDFSLELNLFSESNFKGEHKKIEITGPFGCTNDIPDFRIKSLLSSGSTQVTLHYGRDCVGHVIEQYQGGSGDIDRNVECPGSIFVKHHRSGSC